MKHLLLLLRYGSVGLLSGLLNIAIVYVGVDVLGQDYRWALLATLLITVPASYVAHSRLTYQATGEMSIGQFFKYFVQQLSQFLIGVVLLTLLVEGLHLVPVKGMALVALMMLGYGVLTNTKLVFRSYK